MKQAAASGEIPRRHSTHAKQSNGPCDNAYGIRAFSQDLKSALDCFRGGLFTLFTLNWPSLRVLGIDTGLLTDILL